MRRKEEGHKVLVCTWTAAENLHFYFIIIIIIIFAAWQPAIPFAFHRRDYLGVHWVLCLFSFRVLVGWLVTTSEDYLVLHISFPVKGQQIQITRPRPRLPSTV
jgi:hypothetical protein